MKKFIFFISSIFFLSFQTFGQQPQKLQTKSELQTKVMTKKNISLQSTNIRERAMEKYKNMEQYRKDHNIPKDFPHYIDTGNPKADIAKYQKAKEKWIKKNPKRFELIKNLKL